MLSAIAEGTAHISGFLTGEDCLATMAALQAMGIEIEHDDASSLTVHGKGMHGLAAADAELDMGNSGTAMRLFSGLLCGQPFDSVLRGDASLSGRPMNRVIQPLAKMGARIFSKGGRPPLSIAGGQKLHGIDYELPVASAQVKSAVLIAGLYAKGTTSVTQPAITRDHTERMLSSMGVALDQRHNTVSLRGGSTLQAVNVDVPADLSSAAFALVAAIVADDCEVVVKNVGVNPTRTGVLEILRQMGADIRIENERLMGQEPVADISARSSSLAGIDVEPSLVPLAIDEFPLLFAAAAMANGKTRFSGIAELRVKESDRIGSMVSGLAQLGIEVTESADGAVIHGGTIGGGTVQSFGDHRIAMAFASVASGASDTVLIEDTDTVSTSFPGFMDCMKSIGVNITTSTGGK